MAGLKVMVMLKVMVTLNVWLGLAQG